MEAFFEASGGRLSVVSGYRSVEEQQALWDASDKTGTWVAAPGKSNHNHGVAVDLGFETDDATDWAHANAARFGLMFPMDYEPWHIEPVGVRDGTYHSEVHVAGEAPGTPESYTNPPNGYKHPSDATQRFDLAYQLNMLNGILVGPAPGEINNPNANIATAAEPKSEITGGM